MALGSCQRTFSAALFLTLGVLLHHLEDLANSNCSHRASDSLGLRQSPRICFSSKSGSGVGKIVVRDCAHSERCVPGGAGVGKQGSQGGQAAVRHASIWRRLLRKLSSRKAYRKGLRQLLA